MKSPVSTERHPRPRVTRAVACRLQFYGGVVLLLLVLWGFLYVYVFQWYGQTAIVDFPACRFEAGQTHGLVGLEAEWPGYGRGFDWRFEAGETAPVLWHLDITHFPSSSLRKGFYAVWFPLWVVLLPLGAAGGILLWRGVWMRLAGLRAASS